MLDLGMRNKQGASFIWCFLFCFVVFMPLIINGVYYIDDFGRSLRADPAWARNGRPVADYVTWAINFGGKIQDISPISQLLGTALLSIMSVMIARKYIGDLSPLSLLASLSFLASPFLMENMAFQYDAFPMFLAFFISAIPFLLIRSLSKVQFSALCFFAILISLSLYQASLCVYFVFAFLFYLHEVKIGKSKNAFYLLLIACFSMLASYALYSKFVLPHVISGDYNISKSQSISFDSPYQGLLVLIYNICLFRDLMLTAISPAYMIAMTPIAALFFFSICKIVKDVPKDKLRWPTILLVILSPLIMAFFVVGPMLFLNEPLFRPRVLLGFAAFTVSMTVIACWAIPQNLIKIRLYLFIPIIYVIVMNYTFANALNNQRDYERLVINQVITDAYIPQLQRTNKVMFNGWISIAPVVKPAIIKYPALNILITRLLHDDNGWGWIQLQHYGLNKGFPLANQFKAIEKNLCKSEFIKESNYYNVYQNGDVAIFDFNKKCKKT